MRSKAHVSRLPALVGALLCLAASLHAAEDQTLCVLEFTDVSPAAPPGSDSRAAEESEGELGWLRKGLADMALTVIAGSGAYDVVDREHVRDTLKEQAFGASGFVDPASAAKAGKLLKVDLVLSGSFGMDGDVLRVDAFLLRVASGEVLASATWRGSVSDVLSAPTALVRGILGSVGNDLTPEEISALARVMPREVDAARAYYEGMAAYDEGDYPLALRRYREGARRTGAFPGLHLAVSRTYYLMKETAHAACSAFEAAEQLAAPEAEAGGAPKNAAEAMWLFSEAAMRAGELGNSRGGSAREAKWRVLRRCIDVGDQYERATGEKAKLKPRIVALAQEDIASRRYRRSGQSTIFWNDRRLKPMAWYFSSAKFDWRERKLWSPFVWQTYARFKLADDLAAAGRIADAVRAFDEIQDDYAFLDEAWTPNHEGMVPGIAKRRSIEMLLQHWAATGEIVPCPGYITEINAANPVFERSQPDPEPTRIPDDWDYGGGGGRSSGKFRGGETFIFAAPEGCQISSMEIIPLAPYTTYGTMKVGSVCPFRITRFGEGETVEAWFEETRTVDLAAGTRLVRFSVGWGGRSTPPILWRARFKLEPLDHAAADELRKLAARNPRKKGRDAFIQELERAWSDVRLLGQSYGYTADCHALVKGRDGSLYEAWFTREMKQSQSNNDIRIARVDEEGVTVRLPVSINSDDHETFPWLFRMPDGGYGLTWIRGQVFCGQANYISTSKDLVTWSPPRRMTFPSDRPGRGDLIEWNVVPLRDGTLFEAQNTWCRFSEDGIRWSPKTAIPIPHHSVRRICVDREGKVWVTLRRRHNASRNTRQDLLVSSSWDGKRWSQPVKVSTYSHYPKHCLLPLSTGHIVIAEHETAEGQKSRRRRIGWLVSGDAGKTWREVATTPRPVRQNGFWIGESKGAIVFTSSGSFVRYTMRSRELHEKITSVPIDSEAAGMPEGGATVDDDPMPDVSPHAEAPRVWALPFNDDGLREKYRPLADVFSAYLSSFLVSRAGLTLVEREDMDAILREHELVLSGLGAPGATRERIRAGRLLGADLILAGSIIEASGGIKVAAYLYETETARVRVSSEATGGRSSVGSLAKEVAAGLLAGLGPPRPAPKGAEVDRAPEANLAYMGGLVACINGAYDKAVGRFMEALKLMPLHRQARLWLAKTYVAQQEYGHAFLAFAHLTGGVPGSYGRDDARVGMVECIQRLSPSELRFLQDLCSEIKPVETPEGGHE